MAIEFVGGATASKAGETSGNSTIALNSGLTGGSRSAVQAGDLVIAVFAAGSVADITLGITDGTTGYTLIGSELWSDASSDANLRVAYKFMSSTPDASTTFGPTGGAAFAGTMAVYVFSGVDQTTPLDAGAVTATGDSGKPNPPAITPTSQGAFVVGVGTNTGISTFTSSDLSGFMTVAQVDTQYSALGLGHHAWASGVFDPATFGGGTSAAWAALTLALRPAPANGFFMMF